jgi:Alg9-like mannosyltransferase family
MWSRAKVQSGEYVQRNFSGFIANKLRQVSPFYAYFTHALPKLLIAALPMAMQGMVLDKRIRSLMTPPLVFVLIMSCLGHKEWRFVVYVVPVFNIAASYAIVDLSVRKWLEIFWLNVFQVETW